MAIVFSHRSGKQAAQQSEHWTLGILRNLQAFFWFRVQTESSPAPASVTQAIISKKGA